MSTTAAEAIVDALAAEGTDLIVGIPGTHNLGVWDAIANERGMRAIVPRHEEGAALIANGYARASGRPGTVLAAAGPGVTNTLTGLNTAYVDSVPLLLIATELARSVAGRHLGHIHDINDQLGLMSHVAGWSTRIAGGDDAARTIHAAFARFRAERPRPIVVEATTDVLGETAAADAPGPLTISGRAADAVSVERAAALLRDARRPVILAGGGSVDAAERVVELAERLDAPVLTTSMGMGVIPDDHRLGVGAGFDLDDSFLGELAEADVVVVIGVRFTQYVTRAGKLKMPGSVVQIDLDVGEFGKVVRPEIALLGHAAIVVGQLLEAIPARADAGALDLRGEKARRRDELREAFPLEMGLVDSVLGALPEDGIVACDMTGLAYWIRRVGIAHRPRSVLYPVINAGLGTALPFAIGAGLAHPDRPVVAIAGDAGFQFNIQELATAVELGMSFPVVVVNDAGFQALRPRQHRLYGRSVSADLANPDFPAIARAYGADGVRVGPDELRAALDDALASDRMTIIEVPVTMKHPEAAGAAMHPTTRPLSGDR